MMKLSLPFLLLIALVLGACSQPREAVLASVNGEIITVEDLRAQLRLLRTVRPGQDLDPATRTRLLDQLVRQKLLVMEAEKRGYQHNPSLEEAIREQRRVLRGELTKQIEDAQAQLAQLDEAVRSKALVEAMIAELGNQSQPSQEESRAFYKAQMEKGQVLPPYEQIKDQVRFQILQDRLLKEIQGQYEVKVDQALLESDAIRAP